MENETLRKEIRQLKRALQDISRDHSVTHSPITSRPRNRSKSPLHRRTAPKSRKIPRTQAPQQPEAPPSQEQTEFSLLDNKENTERPLADSFQSFYESEQENIENSGKAQLSYQQYKEEHQKGSRRRNMLLQLQILQNENSELNNKLTSLARSRTAKSVTPLRKSPALRTPKGATRTPRSVSVSSCSVTPRRNKHCKFCDVLLSRGYSTRGCTKHGF